MIEIKLQLAEHGRDSIVDVSSRGFSDDGGRKPSSTGKHSESFW